MLKEIYEQPRVVTDTVQARIDAELGSGALPEANLDARQVQRLHRAVLVASGTSYHAALVGRFMIEWPVSPPRSTSRPSSGIAQTPKQPVTSTGCP